MSRWFVFVALLILCCLAAAARFWNVRDVFIEGRIYFLDGDCYARMTRAREVASGRALVIRHQAFENWPAGTTTHATALMDWSIAALAAVAEVFLRLADPAKTSLLRSQTLDLAGALISPVCGILATGALGWWAWRERLAGWLAVPLLAAISPIMVHGTLLGRPDHQSWQILLVALALAAELTLARRFSRKAGLLAGCAWGAALWVSLYEPAVLLLVVIVFWLAANRARFHARELRPGWLAFAAICAGALWLEGWRISWPDPAFRAQFANWEKTIGELQHLDPRGPLLYRWLGFGVLFAPLALGLSIWRNRPAAGASDLRPCLVLLLLAVTFFLTLWQIRWGYFLSIMAVLSLPWQFSALPQRWLCWPIFLLSLWPLARDWEEKVFPEEYPELEAQRGILRVEAVRLRTVAERMRSPAVQPFLAPWWLSPALAYWSGQPGVAGSSHQSLPGIVASARFFLTPDAAEAEHIVHELGVQWVVTDDPERLADTSRLLLGGPPGDAPSFAAHLHEAGLPRERTTPEDLRSASPAAQSRLLHFADEAEAAQLGSAAFTCVASDQFYKLFRVKSLTVPP